MNTLEPVTMRPVVKQSEPTTAKYAARYRPDCPDPGIGRRSLEADGYYQSPQGWRMSNYLSASQGRHGDIPSASSGEAYSERRTNGGGY